MGYTNKALHSKTNAMTRKITITIELEGDEAEQLIEALLDKEEKDDNREEEKEGQTKKDKG